MTLFEGRLGEPMADDVAAFTASIRFDLALWRVDVAGSRAHVAGLEAAGLLDVTEAAALRESLDQVARELAGGTFALQASDEDIHTAVERRVTELAGPTGAKLHTGRSRNDQVALDLRLYAREAVADVTGAVLSFAGTLARLAEDAADVYLPGYTHLQRAQPVLLSHHLRAHAWALLRDADRLLDAWTRADVSPLGAGALAGSSLALDPRVAARALSFTATFENSLDAVADRDFVAELLFCLSLLGVHLSRMGEELVLWTSAEFGFATLHDRHATGSSMLPQKKNPDVAELARGTAGRLLGALTAVLATLKGLPLAYNRDLQAATEPMLEAVSLVLPALRALEGCYATAAFDAASMAHAADDELSAAVDLAELLVARGMPFRDAHRHVGRLVAASTGSGASLGDLVAADEVLGADARALLAPGVAVTRRTTPGGAGPAVARAQGDALAAALASLRARAGALPRLEHVT